MLNKILTISLLSLLASIKLFAAEINVEGNKRINEETIKVYGAIEKKDNYSNQDINNSEQLLVNIDNNSNQPDTSNDLLNNESNDLLPNTLPVSGVSDEGTHINDDGTNITSVNNTIAQLLNIYQSSGISDSLSAIREQYNQQFEEMLSMGFNDENKIITSLYVCEGNCENAINYYLSLQDDL